MTITDPITKLTEIVNRRIDVAQRWFGMTAINDIAAFVARNRDVEAFLANPVIDRLVTRHARLMVIEEIVDGRNIEQHRQRFGNEFVDRIVATSERLRRQDDASVDDDRQE